MKVFMKSSIVFSGILLLLGLGIFMHPKSAHAQSCLYSHMLVNESLFGSTNDSICNYSSPNAEFKMQSDGNLVYYKTPGNAVWASNTVSAGGSGATYKAIMQGDGNFVVYCYGTSACNNSSGKAIWASNTANSAGIVVQITSTGSHVGVYNSSGGVVKYIY
jgi:hypothetical protein